MRLLEIQNFIDSLNLFSRVSAVADLEQIQKQTVKSPVAFVTPAGTQAEPSQRQTGAALQRLTETYSVIYCVPSINDSTGMKANEQLQSLINATREKLIGYAPTDADLMRFEGGELLTLEAGFAIWHDSFTTSFYIEAK